MTLRTAKRAPPISMRVQDQVEDQHAARHRHQVVRAATDDSSAVTIRLDAAAARTMACRSRRLVKRHHLV